MKELVIVSLVILLALEMVLGSGRWQDLVLQLLVTCFALLWQIERYKNK